MNSFSAEQFLLLIVDDSIERLDCLKSILEPVGYHLVTALGGAEALEKIKIYPPDLILLPLQINDITVLEFCQLIKSNYKDITLIFFDDIVKIDELVKVFDLGGADYITSPFHAEELITKLRTHLELKYTKAHLEQVLNEVEKLTSSDPITQLPNRKSLLTFTESEIARASCYYYPVSLLMIDIENIERLESIDEDAQLRRVAQSTANSLRREDHFGRYCQNKFLAILPYTETQFALKVAHRIKQAITSLSDNEKQEQSKVAVSIGIATYQQKDQSVESLLKRAYEAVVEAKNKGKNHVIVHQYDLEVEDFFDSDNGYSEKILSNYND